MKLTYMTSSEKNRGQNCLTMCNFKLDAVFSDVFGKSASRILDNLIAQGNSQFDVAPLLHKGCKATIEEISAALDGELSYAQSEKLKIIREHMANLKSLQDTLENLIYQLANRFQPEIDLLLTVAGIKSPLTAIRIIAEIGVDMSVFETAKKLCSWAGVTPGDNDVFKFKQIQQSRNSRYFIRLLICFYLA